MLSMMSIFTMWPQPPWQWRLAYLLRGMSKEQNAGFTSSPREFSSSFEPYLNCWKFWLCRSPCLRKGRGCAEQGRPGGGAGQGDGWKSYKIQFPCEPSGTSWFWLHQKYHKSLSWNLQNLWKAFLWAVPHFCMPGFRPGLETEVCSGWKSLLEGYLDTWELSEEVYL